MKIKYISIVLVCLFAVVHAMAETIDGLTSAIVNNNPKYKASQARIEGQREALKAENNLEDPEVEFEHLWGNDLVGNKWNLSVTQSFDWPGVYSSRAKSINYASEALGYLCQTEALDVYDEVKTAIIDAIYARKKMDLWRTISQNMDSLYNVSLRGMREGEISRLDVNRLAVERVEASRSLHDAAAELIAARQNLLYLGADEEMCDAACRAEIETGRFLQPKDHYLAQMRENDPTYKYNMAMKAAKQQESVTARRSLFPKFRLGYSHENEMGDRFNGLVVGITLPVFSQRHKAKVAQLESLEYDFEASAALIKAESELSAKWDRLSLLQKDMLAYEQALDSDYMRLLGVALRAGRISIFEYLQDTNFFTQAQMSYLDICYQYDLQMVRLNRYAQAGK